MRIATWNVNGIRAASRKGMDEHLARVKPDVLLLQEIRALPEQLPPEWREPDAWSCLWHPAQKKGYAGTALCARTSTQDQVQIKEKSRGIDDEGDPEGRVIVARVGPVRVLSVYLPSGSSGEHRQAEKERWLERFDAWAAPMLRSRIPTVMGGDFNIAHTERDLYYAKGNAKNSGFLPHEREWMGALIAMGWHDVVRETHGDRHGPYSWWSNRGRARELDRGWRIDYLLMNKAARKRLTECFIDRESGLGCSDHAMVVADLDLS